MVNLTRGAATVSIQPTLVKCFETKPCGSAFFFPSPQPVVTEVDVERLPAVAVQELSVHSQAHLLVVDLRVQTKTDFPFIPDVWRVYSLPVYLCHEAHIFHHHAVVLWCLQ